MFFRQSEDCQECIFSIQMRLDIGQTFSKKLLTRLLQNPFNQNISIQGQCQFLWCFKDSLKCGNKEESFLKPQ